VPFVLWRVRRPSRLRIPIGIHTILYILSFSHELFSSWTLSFRYFSPLNWYRDSNGAQAANPGAYFRLSFSGSGDVALNLDLGASSG